MPRLRPPYVAQVGLFGRPTLEHNMETVYWVREIVEKGAQWFAAQGRNGRKGLRSFSVSGRVKKPGVHLAPAGITAERADRRILRWHGGRGTALYGYLPGGASGGILPASKADIPLDFDTLQPHGCFIGSAAVVVLSDRDKAAAAAVNLMKFFHDESCGKCTPCRVGTAQGGRADAGKTMEPAAAQGALTGDDGRLDLRPGTGGAEPGAERHEVLSRRDCLMERVTTQQLAMMPIEFKLNGRTVIGRPDEPIITTAQKHGVEIPHLCHGGNQRSDGNCRSCVVEIKGERVLAPSCCRYPSAGMEVTTDSPRALRLAEDGARAAALRHDGEELHARQQGGALGERARGGDSRGFAARRQPKADLSHPAIAVNLDACIQCTRCVRACREVQVNDVIGYAYRGEHSVPVFDFDDPMGESTCVACGECVQACPTGALMPARGVGMQKIDKKVDSRLPVLRRGLPAHLSRQGQRHPVRHRQGRPFEPQPPVRQGALRVRLRASPAPADEAPHQERRRSESRPTSSSIPATGRRCSARRRGKKPSILLRRGLRRYATRIATRWPASARRRARTRRRISSRSWCAPASAPTTSTTARAFAMRRPSPRCSRASARARSPTR